MVERRAIRVSVSDPAGSAPIPVPARRGAAAPTPPVPTPPVPTGRLVTLARRAPWWAWVLAIYSASRVVTTSILMAFAAQQPRNPWTEASPGYLDFARLWDGHWYWIIAAVGYPDEIPRDADGLAQENAWAFMPVYPMLVRAGLALTGGGAATDFAAVAVTISVVAGGAAALFFHALLRRWMSAGAAMLGTALFCVAPLSPIYQVAYAEALHLALLFLALLLVLERRWVPLAPVVTVMALTRPSGLAFALLLALVWLGRWWRARGGIEPFGMRERVTLLSVTAVAGFAGLAWPGIVALATGDFLGYTDTELAWRRPYIGDVHLVPFTPWWQGAQWWLDDVLGPVALVALLLLAVCSFALPAMRRMPIELRFWVVAYSLYLLAVFFPRSSTFRLLVPLAPVLGAIALGIVSAGQGALGRRLPRAAVAPVRGVLAALAIGLGIAGQVLWVHLGWWVDGYDWTPP